MSPQFAEETISWLLSASLNEILAYSDKIPEAKRAAFQDSLDELLNIILLDRNQELASLLGADLSPVLEESEMLQLLHELAQYNPHSVLKAYLERYPGVTATGEPAADLSSRSLEQLLLWKQYFHLVTAQEYREQFILLRSLFNLELSAEQAETISKQASSLYTDILTFITDNNYDPTFLTTDLQRRIVDLMTPLGFFPEQYIKELTQEETSDRLVLQFKRLTNALRHLVGIKKSPEASQVTEEQAGLYLWDSLELDAELNELERRETRRIPSTVSENLQPFTRKAIDLLRADQIASGKAQELLVTSITPLPFQEKQASLGELRTYLINSAEIQAIFDTVDVEYFLTQLTAKQSPNLRAEFIQSLQPKVDPELWPLTEKAMRIMATIF